MALNCSIKYRPVRIGFLVREGSIEDLVRAAEVNTLLWGGIYNPLIPVSDNHNPEGLLKFFSVDILSPVSKTEQIDSLLEKYPFLRDPNNYAENIFFEGWSSKKNLIGFLDSINIIDHYWEKEFKHKSNNFKSNCALINWQADDPLKNLFSISFGAFSEDHNLVDDFKELFLKGLHAQKFKIAKAQSIDPNVMKSIYPLLLTGMKLMNDQIRLDSSGIYIGREDDFHDLLSFWNLRASGLRLEFLPKDHIQRFEGSIKEYLKGLDKMPNPHPNISGHIGVHYRIQNEEEIKGIIRRFKTKKTFLLCRYGENSPSYFGPKAASFYFGWEDALGTIEKLYDRFNVDLSLPEKSFIGESERDIGYQYMVVYLHPLGESGYPQHTLRPPFLQELNEFYSREIAFDPWKLRIEKEGIGILIEANEKFLSLHPLSYQILIPKIFAHAGIGSKISQAGLICNRIIEKLGGVDGGRVFKIRGVRDLLQKLRTEECIERGEATNKIWSDGEFKKYEKLFIEARKKAKLDTSDTFDFLLKKDFFRAGLELSCNHCRLKSWLSMKEIDDIWTCSYCGHENKTSLLLKDRGNWKFRKSGLFAKDNHQEGAIPVILTLQQFLRIFNFSNFIYTTSLELEISSKKLEIDFCILRCGRQDESDIEIGIAECKSDGGKIAQGDIDNFKLVREKLNAVGIRCFFIFSKTTDKFQLEEIELFNNLKMENIPCILMTNKELENYYIYEAYEKEVLPFKHAATLSQMSQNSKYIYLTEK